MNLHFIDWCIVGIMLSCLVGITVFTRKYNRSVSDFLAANRLAGRYLLTVASGFSGAAVMIATWEMFYSNGLPVQWWWMMSAPLGLFIALTGFVIYRFRETRALTLAQFLEMRYSRRFRFFAGFLCWLSGILNFGVFPAITARFIIYFMGFPETFTLWGVTLPTMALVMFVYLGLAVYIACFGGQISIMLTDFFQGMVLLLIFVVIMFFFLHSFGWDELMQGLQYAPENQSMINPFKSAEAENFNIYYFLIGMFGTVYTVRAWQGSSGYNSAARTPHEAVMAGIISNWRTLASGLCLVLIPLCAYAALHSPHLAETMAPVKAQIDSISDPAIRSQMTVPLFLANYLPAGLLGLFAVVVVACAISNDDSYIHAWGTIFVQDVIMPLRKKPFPIKTHLLILRCSIVGVAVFAFIFSLLFPLKDFILMYFSITGSIYLGGAGAVIIGGLYWKRGSAPAAWAAMCTGTILGLSGIVLEQCWGGIAAKLLEVFPHWQFIVDHQDKFPINGQYVYLLTMLSSIGIYVLVSLLGPRHCHNMDKMLHRGEYADKDSCILKKKEKFSIKTILGINSNFSRSDRFIAYMTAAWSLAWWGIFIVLTVIAFTVGLADEFWKSFWWWSLIPFSIILGTGCTVWISIGGVKDTIDILKNLRAERVDESDNGFVEEEK